MRNPENEPVHSDSHPWESLGRQHEHHEHHEHGEQLSVLDHITAEYVEAYRAGRPPNLRTFIRRYPQFARELLDFVLYFHCVAADLPEPDRVPAAHLSPGAQAALARIRRAHGHQHSAPSMPASSRRDDPEEA